MKGKAPNPWRYRVLSEWVASGAVRVSRDVIGAKDPYVTGFWGVRVVQNIAIFLLATAWYRRLGLSDSRILLALSCLAWSMGQMFYNSDLSFNTYGDAIVYLTAGLLLVDGWYLAIIPLSILGALNRETSILVPAFLCVFGLVSVREHRRRAIVVGFVALLLHIAILLTLRWYLGYGGPHTASGSAFGWVALRDNLSMPRTWWRFIATFTVMPVLAIMSWRRWPFELKLLGVTMVPIWTLTQFLISTPAETRHFLVPLSLIIIPGAMYAVVGENSRRLQSHSPPSPLFSRRHRA